MAGHIDISEGSIYIDNREIAAFVYTAHKTDKRAAQLTVYLKSTSQIHLLGVRATKVHTSLCERFPLRDPRLDELSNMQSLPAQPKKKS